MNVFMIIFYVVPELLLGVLLIGAKLEEMFNIQWRILFIPFYIATLVLLGLMIIDERRRRLTGESGVGKIAVQLFAWLLCVIFLGLLVSKLDLDNPFSWSLTIGPLILLMAVAAVFEFTSCFVDQIKTYNILLNRVNSQHIILWFISEVGILVFLYMLGLKLDLTEMETEEDVEPGFVFGWGWVFLPLWISFGLAIPISVLMCKGVSDQRNSESVGTITIVAFLFSWIILLTFFIMLAIETIEPGNISTILMLLPFILGMLLMMLFAFCTYKRDSTSQRMVSTLDVQPLTKDMETGEGITSVLDDINMDEKT